MHFRCVTLKDLGLCFQLGHPAGQFCLFHQSGHADFTVIASNGIYTINVNFCGCPDQPEPYVQLLKMRWWPSMPIALQTVATMDVLQVFYVLNLEACTPPTDFYNSLERITDGQGLMSIPVSLCTCLPIIPC
jgi:hypothetical protein